MGINIVKFDGGLGNQMFQYAFYLAAKDKNSGIWLLDTRSCKGHHYGYEINELFDLGLSLKKLIGEKIITLIKRFSIKIQINNESNGYLFDETNYTSKGLLTIYSGFWQSEKYFSAIEPIVRNAFRFPIDKLNKSTLSLADYLKSTNTVSVHVRRGDYLNEPERGTCTARYYDDCIKYITGIYPNITPIVFSDDISWCRSNLNYREAIYVDWNTGRDSWQDMLLMSLCNHNIIANSSFSWWGAWLNQNQEKIVMCPKRWNYDAPKFSDSCPRKWVRI